MKFTVPPNSGAIERAPRILLVDDDPMVLRASRRALLGARPGWEIEVAESSESAWLLLATRTYDVVVTDLQMPSGGGEALLERLKEEHPAVMRVIHSSHIESLSPARAEELAHATLAKPGRPDELVVALDWALVQRGRTERDSNCG
jgi:DNA-binding NtrC family response regulator